MRPLLLFRLLPMLLAVTHRVLAGDASFAGEWETTYGRMILKEEDGKISGTYEDAGDVNGITGTLEGRKLTFTYT